MLSLKTAFGLGLVCMLGCTLDQGGTQRPTSMDMDGVGTGPDASTGDGSPDEDPHVDAGSHMHPGIDAGEDPQQDGSPAEPDAGTGDGTDADGEPDEVDAGHDAGPPPKQPGPSGSSCTCDDECQGGPNNRGICVIGVCMTQASAPCSSTGSQFECGAGGRCFWLQGYPAGVCWPSCGEVACEGQCDNNGYCVPRADQNCDRACGEICRE